MRRLSLKPQTKSGRRQRRRLPRKSQPKTVDLVLHLDTETHLRLRACAAYDNVTPERFAEQAVRTCIEAAARVMARSSQSDGRKPRVLEDLGIALCP